MKTILQSSIAVAAALFVTSVSGHAQTAYALADNGLSLIKFDLATPGTTTLIGGFSGAALRLDGIDFRPANGLLYGYSQQSNAVVTINLNTAATTLASTPSTGSSTRNLGIDFNPVPDRLRLVNEADQNLRINVTTGATLVDGPLAYAVGDANFGANPAINEAAYTNSDVSPGTGTTLFYIDPTLDILVSTINPNAGSLNTVGPLGVDTTDLTGFDILSDGFGGNTAYALLTAPNSGISSLYTINLMTGAASSVGVIAPPASTSRPFSLAIVQPVPEPGTALFGLALIGASLARNRRKTATGA
jgi:Domain of unknown function (DUF4394)/PEP-CTERM motif